MSLLFTFFVDEDPDSFLLVTTLVLTSSLVDRVEVGYI